MRSSALVFWLTVAVVGSAAYGSWVAWRTAHQETSRSSGSGAHASHPSLPPPGVKIKEFELTDAHGRPFDSKSLKGKVWISSFFYASCPGLCWQMNQVIKGLQDEFKDDDLRFVSITCDPDNDTPQSLTQYANKLGADARWIFLTGDFDYIRRIGRDVFLQDVQKATHTYRALAVDRAGEVQGSFDMLDPAKVGELKMLLKKLLLEKPPEIETIPNAEAQKAESPSEKENVGENSAG